jgi:iron complex transport system permease protein
MNVLIASSDNDQELRSIVYWLQGGLEAKTWEHVSLVVLPIMICIICISFFYKELNLLLLGDEQAQTAGMNIGLIRIVLLVIYILF